MTNRLTPPYARKISSRRQQGFISHNDIFCFIGSKQEVFRYADNHFNRGHDVLVLTLDMDPAQYYWSVVKDRSVLVFELTKEGYPTILIKQFALILLNENATVIYWVTHDGSSIKFTQR